MSHTAVLCVALLAVAVLVWPSSPRVGRAFGEPRRAIEAREASALAVAYVMDLLALALEGGAPVVVALEAVSEASDPLVGDPLARVAAAIRWGVDEERAWAAAPTAWAPAAAAFTLAARAGAAPSSLLRRAATDLRVAEAERVAVAGARAGVRVVLPLGTCFLPAFVLLTVVPLVLGLVHPLG